MSKYDLFPLTPDYPLERQPTPGALRQLADSGRAFQRLKRASAGLFSLDLAARATSEIIQLRDFHSRFQSDYFLLRHDVWQVGSWNLLGPDGDAEHTVIKSFPYLYPFDIADNFHRLGLLGLKPGDKVSLQAELRTSAGGGDSARFNVDWLDVGRGLISTSSTPSEAGATYTVQKLEGVAIPSGAVYFTPSGSYVGAGSETGFIRRAKINRGATAHEYSAPFAAPEYVPRFFPLSFASEPPDRLSGNEGYDSGLSLLEVPGASLPFALYPKPQDYQQGGSFLEETGGIVGAGTWTEAFISVAHGSHQFFNPNLNTSDFFYWIYSGYGCRVWFEKDINMGIPELFVDGVSQGTIDLYASPGTAAAPLFTKLDLPLGLHIVKIKATNSKNASSSDKQIVADAIEYIP